MNLSTCSKWFGKTMLAVAAFVLGSAAAFAQTKTVSGTVLDNFGESVIGANVVIVGTQEGTMTDVNGNFTLNNVPQNGTLRISYIGYATQEISVAGKSNIKVTLQEEGEDLDEVVVVGYGVQRKRDLTGSVASIKAADIQNVAAPNAMQAMQAKVPGLDLTQASGQAGGAVNINLRGARSLLADNDPLILVDGVEYGSTLDLNPSDIESMEVLKDASSTAIYGSRGANGVILITTKRGKVGKTHVHFNFYNAWNSPTNVATSMYGQQEVQRLIDQVDYNANYATYQATGQWGDSHATVADVTAGRTLTDGTETASIVADGSYTDWGDLLLKNSTTQSYEVGVNGGNENTQFALSLGTLIDRGLLANDKVDRYNGKLNIDHKINDMFKTGASLLFTYKDNDRANSGVFNQLLKMTSITHPYLNDGTINETPNPWYEAHSNPLLDYVDGRYQRNVESTRFFGNAYLEIKPIKDLIFRTQFAVDRRDTRDGLYQDYLSTSRLQSPRTNYISNNRYSQTSYTWDNTLTYMTQIEDHSITALLGHEMTQYVLDGNTVYGDAGKTHYYQSSFYDLTKIESPVNKPEYTKKSMVSFFGRLNYNYLGRYLLQATLRGDGASQLAEGNKWGIFPSASLGWRIIDESWMESTKDWMDNLKIRLSWGISGNSAVDPYQTMATLSELPLYYYFGGNSVAGKIPANMGNESLEWEKTSAVNLGVDFGFFGNRLNGSIEYYWSNTKDLLFYQTAPASSVYTSVIGNVGKTKGQGLEIALNGRPVVTDDFSWDLSATYTWSTDEITGLTEGVDKREDSTTSAMIVGERAHTYYDYECAGTWNIGEYDTYIANNKFYDEDGNEVDANYPAGYGQPGSMKVVDRNMDGMINSDDRRVYERDPKHIIGLNSTWTYKNFSLSAQMIARMGGYIQYGMNNQLQTETANWGGGTTDYWTPENPGAKFPNPGAMGSIYSFYKTSLLYEKGDFFKIKDITLSYNMPKKWISPAGLSSVRVYGSFKNFFTWSKIDDFDPEAGGSISFPLAKQFVLGLNVEF